MERSVTALAVAAIEANSKCEPLQAVSSLRSGFRLLLPLSPASRRKTLADASVRSLAHSFSQSSIPPSIPIDRQVCERRCVRLGLRCSTECSHRNPQSMPVSAVKGTPERIPHCIMILQTRCFIHPSPSSTCEKINPSHSLHMVFFNTTLAHTRVIVSARLISNK
eukprot:4591478-Prymnesium_polylepis.1